uniref:phosphatidate phosphatase n=1 Tax=Geotrypetes seraphini TaxID=260995 RepID=A0A6P8P5Q5_GEOSA|nr:phosphatidate phosphatase LPIN3 [Geotrypetes seraphini]XP_033770429.1 phosphatidate phosphatase LPIN3 [Geotrypetes seraphini]XP_033770430.1 phosphatidate phosphatase LPIN3 [Geotrypetes seraphini]XP_033770431.1 phosphatidate phosphatase LPIN3 [Geotrypetes seraphini]
MNYVGQLAESVFVTVKELYKGLNPATLTGCIDVLVVRQADGSYQCSPFHVRFGKLGVLRSREKVVDIEINGLPVDLRMKLGDNGEAFFVQETETSEEKVPAHLSTSPLPLQDSDCADYLPARTCQDLFTSQFSPIKDPEATGSDTSVRKKKRRRKKSKAKESPKRDDTEISSDDETENEIGLDDKHKILATSNSIYFSVTDISNLEISISQTKERYPSSDGEYTPPVQSLFLNRPTYPKTDSELEIKSSDVPLGRAESHMQWTWGRLPQVSKWERTEPPKSALSSLTAHRPLPASKDDNIMSIWPSESTHFRAITEDSLDEPQTLYSKDSSPLTSLLRPEPLFQNSSGPSVSGKARRAETAHAGKRAECPGVEAQRLEIRKPLEATGGEKTSEAKAEEFKLVLHIEEVPGTSQTGSQCIKPADCDVNTELKPGKQNRKGSLKRSQHQGPSDIYLDDIVKLNSEEIALYFPKSDAAPPPKPCTDASSSCPGNSMNDSGMENFSDPTCELVDNIMLSLCGGLGDGREIQHEKFMQHALSYDTLSENPAILEDPNLVVRINNKYYNWTVAAPIILSLQAFQKNLPKNTVDKLVKEKMPKKSGRWWFSWRRKDFSIEENETTAEKDEAEVAKKNSFLKRKKKFATSSEDEAAYREEHSKAPSKPRDTSESVFVPTYKKSLRLSSQQISRLNLRDGANRATFSVTTPFQGTCRCEATIYLWNWDDKVVISDIDGTITKSDALGHILPHLGKDWTHQGIATLYHKIHTNGYKFLYCSARAIGLAELTKDYLHWVNDQGCELPKGPILLAPSSLLSALHREVIEKKPEVFKIACLTDIKNLFGPQQEPFYAAFGNRKNDVYAYKQVGLPESRIFTVNPKGEVFQELFKTKSSYTRLGELVELIFPPVPHTSASSLLCPEFSNFSFWRDPVSKVSLEEMVDTS